MQGVEIEFLPESEPRSGLEEGVVYPAEIIDYQEGTYKSGEPYIAWIVQVNDYGSHWRKLPQSALRTHISGPYASTFRRLLDVTGVMSVKQQKELGKAVVNFDDLLQKWFLARITYKDFSGVETEYPRVDQVRRYIEPEQTSDLPF